MRTGQVMALSRYPVKSMAGEQLEQADVDLRGLVGDRGWAVRTGDGGIGSGKSSRRFRRVDGLLDLAARCDDDLVPRVALPDGRELRADDPGADVAVSAVLGRELELRPELDVAHHDDSPVHVITTAGLRRLAEVLGAPVDPARFRANVVLDVEGTGFVEDTWRGRRLRLGSQVVLRLGTGMPRCVMVGLPQPHADLGRDARLLTVLGRVHAVEFGLGAEVLHAGEVRLGDAAVLA